MATDLMEYFVILAAITIYLVLAWLVATMAQRRGRSLPLFAAISVLLTPLVGLVVLLIATSGKSSEHGDKLVRCPVCAEWIQPLATKCRFCGAALTPAQPAAPAPLSQQDGYPAPYPQPGPPPQYPPQMYAPQPAPPAPRPYTVVPPSAPPQPAQPYGAPGPRVAQPPLQQPAPGPVSPPLAPALPSTPVAQIPPPPPAPQAQRPQPQMPPPQPPAPQAPRPQPQMPPAQPPQPPRTVDPLPAAPSPPRPPAPAAPPQARPQGAPPVVAQTGQPAAYPAAPGAYPTQPVQYPTQPVQYATQPIQQPAAPPAPPVPLTEAQEIAARIERMRHAPSSEHPAGFYEKVQQWFRHEDPNVREEAVRFFGKHCQSLSDAAPLLDMLTSDSNVEVRRASAECLGGLYRATRNRPANEKLADVARNADEDETVRAAAYAAIRRINGR